MSKDLDAPTVPAAPDDAATPFVRVLREKDTGNVLIALNPEAMDALLIILDAADLKEMADNPDYVGLTRQDGELVSAVGYDILGQLKSLAPYVY